MAFWSQNNKEANRSYRKMIFVAGIVSFFLVAQESVRADNPIIAQI
jgi:hypothetical protein